MLISIYTDLDDKTVTFYLSHPLTPEIHHPVFVLHGLDEVAELTNMLLQSVEWLMGVKEKLSPEIIDFINSINVRDN